MKIEHFSNDLQMGKRAATIVIEEIGKNPELLLCCAAGSSPATLYNQLVKHAIANTLLFKKMRIIMLDEWLGVNNTDTSCDTYIRNELITPLSISENRYISFNTSTENPTDECKRIQSELKAKGPIDICILGLGKNGHLGFNEPGTFLQANCHLAPLTLESLQHNMIADTVAKPTYGITLGMEDILASKRIVLIVSGKSKNEAKQKLLSAKISTQCPASFLWLHKNVDCLIVNN